ncbi:Putative protein kinase [Colletotrichum destructivum]|uniref:Protein kinase domain-containing protein n=1 Tax=Colletotrichum destructivum TaxID=34406 RepID=A0AAX4IJ08_9PEZI|nr:Putative protein kinase [Colletotrichum destructivum]
MSTRRGIHETPDVERMSSPPLTPPREKPTSRKEYRFRVTGTPCEWAESYRLGGFHPVHFGDVFKGRYEVIRKLGNGSFGTFLHSNGVVHGDLQFGNILFALQDLSTIGPEKLKQDESTSRINYLHRIDGKPDKWAPKYLAASQPLSKYTMKEPNDDTKLSDLCGAFFINEPPEKIVTPMSLRAPELILGEPFSIGVDIWSFGCLLFEIVTGTSLVQLPPFGLSDEALKDEHLIQLTDIIQPLPENLIEKWPASDFDEDDLGEGDDGHEDTEGDVVGFNDNDDFGFDIGERIPPQTLDSLEKLISDNKAADVDEAEEKKMTSLLRSIFQYNPARRPSAADLLEHAWLKG